MDPDVTVRVENEPVKYADSHTWFMFKRSIKIYIH